MSKLMVTLIDVGWGDSILIEAQNMSGSHYALIDSNDTATLRSSHIFLKRFFERRGVHFPVQAPLFDWVMLSHVHADHGQGLKGVMRTFDTKRFWYPKSRHNPVFFSALLRYANHSGIQHQAVDNSKVLPNLGDASLSVLWPSPEFDEDPLSSNENNNSIVLLIEQGDISVVLSGDAEGEVWQRIAHQIPDNTRFFKVPHHGSRNGFYLNDGTPGWLSDVNQNSVLGISSHIRPFSHPHPEVLQDLGFAKRNVLRTDLHYHVTFEVEDGTSKVIYSHAE